MDDGSGRPCSSGRRGLRGRCGALDAERGLDGVRPGLSDRRPGSLRPGHAAHAAALRAPREGHDLQGGARGRSRRDGRRRRQGRAQRAPRDRASHAGADRRAGESDATRRVWIAPHTRVAALVADMRAHDIEVRVGRGPSSARGTPTGVVFVDTARTTATKLVLYTESTSGTIWRLTSDPYRIGTPTRAGRGIAVHPAPPARAFPYRPPTGSSVARVGVTTTYGELGSVSFLLTLTSDNRVDAVLIGSLLTP